MSDFIKDRPLRVGIVGVGMIGKNHLNIYQEMPDRAQVVAICDIDTPEAERVAKKYGIPEKDIHYWFRDMLKRDDIDTVDVCLHNNLHPAVTIAALQAGKHVYCEKPMAGSYCDAVEMARVAQETGQKLYVQLNTLFDLKTRAAKVLIDAGKLGKLYHARSVGDRRRGRPYVDGYGRMQFVQKEISGGGAMYDMAVYHVCQLLYLLGNPEVLTISGKTYQETEMDEERRKISGYSVEELGVGFVRFVNDITMDIIEPWAMHMVIEEGCSIAGSAGGIRLDPWCYFSNLGDLDLNTTVDFDDYNWRLHSIRDNPDAYENAQKHWVAAMQGRVEMYPAVSYALNHMLISEGIFLSSKLGREVTAEEVKKTSKSTALKL